jgi:hypothetical protein
MDAALRALQDFGLLHLGDASRVPGLAPPPLDARTTRHRRYALRTLDDIDDALRLIGAGPRSNGFAPAGPGDRAPATPRGRPGVSTNAPARSTTSGACSSGIGTFSPRYGPSWRGWPAHRA